MANLRAVDPIWSGRTSVPTSEIFKTFVDSISFDKVLAPYDIAVSKAHCKMLYEVGIIDKQTHQEINDGLSEISKTIDNGDFFANIETSDEDIHSAIERILTDIAGDAGKALHTGRSRNDLSQMSVRLYTREAIISLQQLLKDIISTLCELAEKNLDIIFPGKTHLQHAQPILLSQWLVSHANRFKNDLDRLSDTYQRVNICVLGSGALAGSTLPLDANIVASELGCDSVSTNSIFAVSTRDYLSEVLFDCAQIVINLSCLGEDIVWMSSTECGYVRLHDQFSSGSSMMPQKKNPDIAELVRGKAGLTIGSLVSVLAATKSQIFGYNHDLQVDKEALFPSLRDTEISLIAVQAMMAASVFNKDRCERSLEAEPLLLATDIAEEMVNSGIAFRIAYKQVASTIRDSMDQGLSGKDLISYLCADKNIGDASKKIFGFGESDLLGAMKASVERRNTLGGTSTSSVKMQIKALTEAISQ